MRTGSIIHFSINHRSFKKRRKVTVDIVEFTSNILAIDEVTTSGIGNGCPFVLTPPFTVLLCIPIIIIRCILHGTKDIQFCANRIQFPRYFI